MPESALFAIPQTPPVAAIDQDVDRVAPATVRGWLILGVFLLNAIVIAVGVQNLRVSRERTHEQVLQTTSNLANLLVGNIADSARGIDLALLHIADTVEREFSRARWRDADIEAFLETQRRRHPEVTAFRLTDAQGDVRWGRGADNGAATNLADRDHFIQHKAAPGRQLIVTEPLEVRIQKSWAIVFSRSYRHADGAFAGIVTAVVRLEHFTQMLAPLNLGPRGSVVVRHENTALVTRLPPVAGEPGAPGVKNATPEFKVALESGQASLSYFTPRAPDGHARTYAFRRVGSLPLVILVGMAPEDYLQPWRAELHTTLALLAAFALLSTGAAWLIWRRWRQHWQDSAALRAQKAELRASQQRLALATESAGIGVWDYDVVNNRLIWDERMYRMYGVSKERFGGAYEAWLAGVHPDDLGAASRAVAEAISRRQPFKAEFRVVRPDGEVRFISANATLIADEGGAVRRMIGVNIDVTEGRRRELALHEAMEAAETANVAKSRFLATMSHEIRTPMNGILGMAQLLLLPDLDEQERQEYARVILNSGQILLALLNDILDLSKIEAGKVELQMVVFQPARLLQETAALFEESFRAKGVCLETVWHGPADAAYRADATRLRQMLANLVGNALKFTPSGNVRIEGRLVVAPAQTPGSEAQLEFSVSDSGIGIPLDKQALLFKPFSQVDASTTREYGGTGLGLSIVRNLARLMQGEVGLVSEPGKGSRFWFRVGVQHVEGREERRQIGREVKVFDPATAAQRQILLVEDNDANRQVIEFMLKKQGLLFESVGNGQQAVKRITTGIRPALVLMDCNMPVLDGYQATRQIRAWEQENALPRLPIVALTAGAYDEDRQRCLEAGMDDFLTKPIDLNRLLATMETLLKPDGD